MGAVGLELFDSPELEEEESNFMGFEPAVLFQAEYSALCELIECQERVDEVVNPVLLPQLSGLSRSMSEIVEESFLNARVSTPQGSGAGGIGSTGGSLPSSAQTSDFRIPFSALKPSAPIFEGRRLSYTTPIVTLFPPPRSPSEVVASNDLPVEEAQQGALASISESFEFEGFSPQVQKLLIPSNQSSVFGLVFDSDSDSDIFEGSIQGEYLSDSYIGEIVIEPEPEQIVTGPRTRSKAAVQEHSHTLAYPLEYARRRKLN